jgi:hypothetical protein
MRVLQKCGLYDDADIYISASSMGPKIGDLEQITAAEFPKAKLRNVFNKNLWEYPGLKTVHELGQEEDSLILYHHSRGITRNQDGWGRLAKQTIENYKEITEVFDNTETDLVGVAPSLEGWIWFNFMWVRSSYLQQCRPPLHPRVVEKHGGRRDYYESYIRIMSKREPVTYSPIIKSDRVNGHGAWEVLASIV